MAVRRRTDKRRGELSGDALAWLEDRPCGFFKFKGDDYLANLWKTHGDAVVAEHVEDFPGTRPARWWEYDSPRSPLGTYPGAGYDGELPQPRARMGGTGTPAYEVKCFKPSFSYGIPNTWVGIDEDDPPVFESQAAYLKRHGFLFASEERRAEFEPETVPVSWDWFPHISQPKSL
jgi:hypothetical protein